MGGDWLVFGKQQRQLALCRWCKTHLYELASVKLYELASVKDIKASEKGIKRLARDMDSDSDPCTSHKTSEGSLPSDSD